MLIIVEGPNRSGKSTICKELHDKLDKSLLLTQTGQEKFYNPGFGQLYCRQNDNVRNSTMLNFYFQCVKPEGMHLIVDRFHISSAVYARTLRKDRDGMQDMIDLEKIFRDHAVLVFPVEALSISQANLVKRQKKFDDLVRNENGFFRELIQISKIKYKCPVDFDNMGPGIDNVIDVVNHFGYDDNPY